jgi:hypothetical protein
MSGSAGGNRISRAAVENTVKDYIEKVIIEGDVNLDCDDFTNYLRVYAVGKNYFKFNNIKSVYVDSQGSTECIIFNVHNSCNYFVGNSFIKVNSKNINNLKIQARGELNADVFGTINDFNCDLSGICNIDVFGKVHNKKIKKKGICKISIVN